MHAGDLLPVAQEETRRLERLVDDAAAVVAHVEHDALGALVDEVGDRVGGFVGRVFVERLQRDVADVVTENSAVRDRRHVHDAPREAELDRLGHAGARVRHRHLRTRLAAEQRRNLGDVDVRRRYGIDGDDAIAFTHARLFGRRVREHPVHDDDAAPLIGEEHSGAAIASTGRSLERLGFLGGKELAVWIVQLFHQTARRLLVARADRDRIDVLISHQRHDLVEQGGVGPRRRFLQEESAGDDGDDEQRSRGRGAKTWHQTTYKKKGLRGRTEAGLTSTDLRVRRVAVTPGRCNMVRALAANFLRRRRCFRRVTRGVEHATSLGSDVVVLFEQ